jgi:iron complex outermembrane receptor protein
MEKLLMDFANRKLRASLLLGAATALALGMGGAASAAESESNIETVVVTGSHIVSPNLQATSPVMEVTAQNIKVSGLNKIDDYLSKLPQIYASASETNTISNGTSGIASVDLRGMGCDRTMVLIDGQRMPYGSPDDSCVDLNQIPNLLIDRVDVLTGGSSAVYGSDAIAGVVNFVTKKDFEGVKFSAQYGIYEHGNDYSGRGNIRDAIANMHEHNPDQYKLPSDTVWDGAGKVLEAMIGVNSASGKGNLTAYFSYRQNDAIVGSNRDYSACDISSGMDDNHTYICGGSGQAAAVTRLVIGDNYDLAVDPKSGAVRDFDRSTDLYNYSPTMHFQRPDERYSFGVVGHYDYNPRLNLYTQMMYTHYTTDAQIAASGDFMRTTTLNCGNPLVPGEIISDMGCSAADISANTAQAALISRRNLEGGPRFDNFNYTSYRALLGAKGDIVDGWTYDATAIYSRVDMKEIYHNDFSVSRLKRALNVVKDSSGNPVCASTLDGTDSSCVPYDIFTPGGVSQAALKYLEIPLMRNGSTTQSSLSVMFNGDLGTYGIKSPFASHGVEVVLGADYRQDTIESTPDMGYQTQDGAGQSGTYMPISGGTHVAEGFLEANIPLVEDKFLARSASLELAYRYSSYDHTTANTFKVGADWAPVEDFRLRVSYDRAIRAANVIELYTSKHTNLFNMSDPDPCGAGGYATLAACQSTPGAGSASWYHSGFLNQDSSQYYYQQGGNENLKPEKADTYTIGFVATPEAIPGLTVSVDFFHIQVYGLISEIGPGNTLTACYQQHDSAACSRIHRDPTYGTLWLEGAYVEDLNTNIGGEKTSGIDFAADYQLDLDKVGATGFGRLDFNLNGTYLRSYYPSTNVNDCLGKYSGPGDECQSPTPMWRHNLSMNWETPWNKLVTTFTWRFIGGTGLYKGDKSDQDYHMPAASYFDLSFAMPVWDKMDMRLGVNNIFDFDPPISSNAAASSYGNGNTFPQVYDALGRYMFMQLSYEL